MWSFLFPIFLNDQALLLPGHANSHCQGQSHLQVNRIWLLIVSLFLMLLTHFILSCIKLENCYSLIECEFLLLIFSLGTLVISLTLICFVQHVHTLALKS